jgi:acyl-CoA synthetase (NDP forming)
VVGNSDALGLLAADAADAVGLDVGEPVALGADATAEDFEHALDAALDDASIDAVVAVYIPPLEASGEDVADVLAAVGEQSHKPIVSTFLGREGFPELLRVADLEGDAGRGSVPSYPAVEAAVRALSHAVTYAQWLRRPAGQVPLLDDVRPAPARRTVEGLLLDFPQGGRLDRAQIRTVLGAYGIDVWDQRPVSSADEAVRAAVELGWHVVLKAQAERFRDRPDMAFVWRSIDDEHDMREAWQSLAGPLEDPGSGEFVVQQMAPAGVPVSVRGFEDPLFGPIMSFGLAGAPSELLGDRSYGIPPMTDVDTASMVREIRSAPLLQGYRGAEPVDLSAIEEVIQRVARLKHDLPRLVLIDLALVMATPHGVCVLDVEAEAAPVGQTRDDRSPRRLARMAGDTLPG